VFLMVVNKPEAFGCGHPSYEAAAHKIRRLSASSSRTLRELWRAGANSSSDLSIEESGGLDLPNRMTSPVKRPS